MIRILVSVLLAALLVATPANAIPVSRGSVTNVCSIIYTAPNATKLVLVRNVSAVSVYVGATGCTTANSFEIIAGDSASFAVAPLDKIWAIAATAGPHTVHMAENPYF